MYFIEVILLKDLTKRGNQASLACFPNLSGYIEQGSLIEKWGVYTTSEYFQVDNFEGNLSKTRREVSFLFFQIGRDALRHSMGESRPYQNIAQILFTKAKERHSIQTLDSE